MKTDKLWEYLETELHYAKESLEKEKKLTERSNIYWYAVQRGLGACQFAQMASLLTYAEIEPMFEEYKKELELMTYDY